jgi:hypothetical protein
MVALTMTRSTIHSGYERADLFRLEVENRSPSHLLGLYGQDPTVLARPRHVLPEEMLYETTDGRQPAITCGGGVSSMRLDVVEKPEDRSRFNVVQR